MGYPNASMAQDPSLNSQNLNPQEMLGSAADLINPVVAARQMPWLINELLLILLNRSGLTPDESDPRFADPTWRKT